MPQVLRSIRWPDLYLACHLLMFLYIHLYRSPVSLYCSIVLSLYLSISRSSVLSYRRRSVMQRRIQVRSLKLATSSRADEPLSSSYWCCRSLLLLPVQLRLWYSFGPKSFPSSLPPCLSTPSLFFFTLRNALHIFCLRQVANPLGTRRATQVLSFSSTDLLAATC